MFFKALELIIWLLHSILAGCVIFVVASARTLLTRDCNRIFAALSQKDSVHPSRNSPFFLRLLYFIYLPIKSLHFWITIHLQSWMADHFLWLLLTCTFMGRQLGRSQLHCHQTNSFSIPFRNWFKGFWCTSKCLHRRCGCKLLGAD